MGLVLRQAEPNDAAICGRICYEAFKAIANQHNFIPDFPDVETAIAIISTHLARDGCYSVVAQEDGRIVGSNFLDERNPISGVGPITVDPQAQARGAGRRLMQAVMERSERRGFPGIRLVQAGYNMRSLSLYTKLGFAVREHLSCMQGPAIRQTIPGFIVRPAAAGDVEACNRLCSRVHGHHRGGELKEAVARGVAAVAERGGRLTGYSTSIAFFAHAVAETNDDLKALIGAADSFEGPGFLVPSRNQELMHWCLEQGIKVSQAMTLMTIGLYNEPAGAYLPSVTY